MREGDLKSDLSTAVFLYYDSRRTRPTHSSSIADCGEEPRDFSLLGHWIVRGRERRHPFGQGA